jgi:hypothetical protein
LRKLCADRTAPAAVSASIHHMQLRCMPGTLVATGHDHAFTDATTAVPTSAPVAASQHVEPVLWVIFHLAQSPEPS